MKYHIRWKSLIIGIVWFGVALFVISAYYSGTLRSFRIPAFLWIIYQTLGVEVGSIVQIVCSVLLIFFSFGKQPNPVETATMSTPVAHLSDEENYKTTDQSDDTILANDTINE